VCRIVLVSCSLGLLLIGFLSGLIAYADIVMVFGHDRATERCAFSDTGPLSHASGLDGSLRWGYWALALRSSRFFQDLVGPYSGGGGFVGK